MPVSRIADKREAGGKINTADLTNGDDLAVALNRDLRDEGKLREVGLDSAVFAEAVLNPPRKHHGESFRS